MVFPSCGTLPGAATKALTVSESVVSYVRLAPPLTVEYVFKGSFEVY